MASSINPTNLPKTSPAPPKGMTDVGYMLQDPTVEGAHVDTMQLNLQGQDKPTSDDYAMSVAVAPNADGKYVFDAKDTKNFLPMTILANLQRGFSIFSQYCDNLPATWATGQKQLILHPDDGEDFNAYYNREEFQGVEPGVHFFHGTDPKTGETVYSGSSGEVTAHEGGPGHALLDRFRPGYFSTWSTDPAAFHESFGDLSSMMVMLKDPGIVDQVAAQTGGDLSKHNVISDLGEQLGATINNYVESMGGPANYTGGKYVRTMINDFKWQDPSTLPDRPSNSSQMSSEPHDWSRLWSGSVYEVLTKMVAQNMAGGMDAKAAISAGNEDLLKIYGKMISNTAPEGDFTYRDMANAMIAADGLTGGKWGGLIKDVMTERQILGDAPAPPNTPPNSGGNNTPPNNGNGNGNDGNGWPPNNGNDGSKAGFAPHAPVKGSHKVTASFTGNEKVFDGTPLANLGKFTADTLQSGSAHSFTAADNHRVTGQLSKDLARLSNQGKILFTTPDQQVSGKDLINPKTKEPYVGVVQWVDGQPHIHRLAMAG